MSCRVIRKVGDTSEGHVSRRKVYATSNLVSKLPERRRSSVAFGPSILAVHRRFGSHCCLVVAMTFLFARETVLADNR